jgi:hypothetical protein
MGESDDEKLVASVVSEITGVIRDVA